MVVGVAEYELVKQYKEILSAPLAAITINYSLSSSLEKGVLDKIRELV